MSDITPIVEYITTINPKFQDWFNHLSSYDKYSFEGNLDQVIFKLILEEMGKKKQRWPNKGDKIKAAREIKHHWFREVIENSKKLEIGQWYTVKSCEVYSSWCKIEIEEMEGSFCRSTFE